MSKKSNSLIDATTLATCRRKLLLEKENILNRLLQIRSDIRSRDNHGDEADQSAKALFEHQTLIAQDKLAKHLVEVEQALARIEQGSFGVCEITEEFIEAARLVALPWTRLSIEGAEYHESLQKRFVALTP